MIEELDTRPDDVIDGQARDVTPDAPPASGVIPATPEPAPTAPRPKRRYTGAPVEAIEAGGDWAETFWIRTTLTFEDVAQIEMQRRALGVGENSADMVASARLIMWLGGRLLERWTLQDRPATPDELAKLPQDMVAPMLTAVGRFLSSKS